MRLRFVRDRKGVVAVEFAFVAFPFIWLLLGLLEVALFFTTSSLLAEAANVGARQVRIGQMEQESDPAQAFRRTVCDRAAVFIPCSDIQFQVQPIASGNFGDADMSPSFGDDGNLEGSGYQDGQQSSIMMVRLVYRHPFMTPLLGPIFADGPGQTRMIVNTIVMKNEPYDV